MKQFRITCEFVILHLLHVFLYYRFHYFHYFQPIIFYFLFFIFFHFSKIVKCDCKIVEFAIAQYCRFPKYNYTCTMTHSNNNNTYTHTYIHDRQCIPVHSTHAIPSPFIHDLFPSTVVRSLCGLSISGCCLDTHFSNNNSHTHATASKLHVSGNVAAPFEARVSAALTATHCGTGTVCCCYKLSSKAGEICSTGTYKGK